MGIEIPREGYYVRVNFINGKQSVIMPATHLEEQPFWVRGAREDNPQLACITWPAMFISSIEYMNEEEKKAEEDRIAKAIAAVAEMSTKEKGVGREKAN